MVRAFAATFGFGVALAGILFGAAGRWDLPAFWAYLATTMAPGLALLGLLGRRSPDLVEERLHPGPGEQDHLSVAALSLTMLAHWVIAGLDVGRFHWSRGMPGIVRFLGFLGYAGGIGVLGWAMLTNQFFSSAVRIQADRGQYVISSGPYRFVRHPGYTGALFLLLGSGLALGSWRSVLPMLLAVGVLLRRTRMEDRMLHQELPGYAGYAQRVRYRLWPGVW